MQFDEVTKSYPRYLQILAGFKASLLHLPETIRAYQRQQFLAVDNLSFQITRGETVALIGPNGSGKSTTLSLMAGILQPQCGGILVNGRVCPLLELGAGFHYELTGRENILLNGVLLGMSRRDIRDHMDEIVAFSELERFLDQPIRTYSSGMVARLGFATAVHLDPDVLLVDEVLAVGDIRFQSKCFRKIEELKRRNTTIVVVSHSLAEVRGLCERALWLEGGRLVADGPVEEVVSEYAK